MRYFLEILNYIGPFVGVLIGWFLSRKSEKDKIKYDEQKKVKRTLFILFEIRNGILQSKILDKYIHIYINFVKEKFKIDKPNSQDYPEIYKFFKELILTIIKDEDDFDLNEIFNECIDNLSEINPILAYRISGKQNIKHFIENWEKETKKNLENENINEVEQMINHFRPKMINEMLNNLSDIINEVAELVKDKKLKQEIAESLEEPTDSDYEKNIRELLERMIKGVE